MAEDADKTIDTEDEPGFVRIVVPESRRQQVLDYLKSLEGDEGGDEVEGFMVRGIGGAMMGTTMLTQLPTTTNSACWNSGANGTDCTGGDKDSVNV
jgi:hypothetical protein